MKAPSIHAVSVLLRTMFVLIQVEMLARAEKILKENTFTILRLEDARDGINRMGWCGRKECGIAVTEKTGMNVLGTPYYKESASGKCAVCGEAAIDVLYAAKAY